MTDQIGLAHLFRHEYGQLVASLVRRTGTQHLERVEDAVQHAMMRGVDVWPRKGKPENPSAWLYQVAYRQLMTELRATTRHQQLLANADINDAHQDDEVPLSGEMQDDMLRMIFVICREPLPLESQLVFTLKSICGFNTREIAQRLFISEARMF